MQSMPFTTNVVSSNPAHVEVYSIQYNKIRFEAGQLFSPGTHISATNKIDRHNIAEIFASVYMLN